MSYDAECYCDNGVVALCVFCEIEAGDRLKRLASNLAIGGALCRAWKLHGVYMGGGVQWQPGCGKEAP